jgi:hypothetical protein
MEAKWAKGCMKDSGVIWQGLEGPVAGIMTARPPNWREAFLNISLTLIQVLSHES